jgi:Glycogen recognition site of AMP-activated protein kinase
MMSHREVRPDYDEATGGSIGRVVTALRSPVPVRAEWRAGLLRGIAMLPAPGATDAHAVRRWSLRPVTAIAAGIACAIVGATLAAALLGRSRSGGSGDVLANLTATMPLPGERGGQSTVRFVFVAPYASRVSLVGDFNAWNPKTMPMRRSPDGRAWLLDVSLAPGRHVYSFVVDGDLAPDPTAPRAAEDDFGVPSSVVLVAGAKT